MMMIVYDIIEYDIMVLIYDKVVQGFRLALTVTGTPAARCQWYRGHGAGETTASTVMAFPGG